LKPKETDFEPQTVGDHIRKRRLLLKLTRKAVACVLKVSQFSIINWERGNFQPTKASTLHCIIEFLGYEPLPEGRSEADLMGEMADRWNKNHSKRSLNKP
jgi:DNA-binding XRE family transcriptional regulator